MSDSWLPIAGPDMRGELDRLWRNQRAAANNLANINTPGFVGTRVERGTDPFSDQLTRAMTRSDPRHLGGLDGAAPAEPVVRAVDDLSPDAEMAEVARTQVRYQTYLDVVGRRDRLVRAAIDGR